MAWLIKKYYRDEESMPKGLKSLNAGYDIIDKHPLFSRLKGTIIARNSHLNEKGSIACVTGNGDIFVNIFTNLTSNEWAYVIAHNLLHLAFGHFDKSKMPSHEKIYSYVWNKACDIYIARFLEDVKFGKPIFPDPASEYSIKLNDERKIYDYLIKTENENPKQTYGLNTDYKKDLVGIDHPKTYKSGETNEYVDRFSYAINRSVRKAVCKVSGQDFSQKQDTVVTKAAEWFLTHYPFLGGIAATFKIIEDIDFCHKHDIYIAAVNTANGEIYINPSCSLTLDEWKFVLAHEYLHAGLCHRERCQGRDFYLWNIACDYVINDWLYEMKIGKMPNDNVLYDKNLHNMSAEAIYDKIVKELRRTKKYSTFRGYGKGDIFGDTNPHFARIDKGVTLDELFKNSLREGLDYHITHNRGYLPAGLVEEIRALSMPPIPWEVQLAKWFDERFPMLEKHRTYARASRRQSSTPTIPRPSYIFQEKDFESRTFGVVLDTSGSMSSSQIGLALGAIASYAISKDVRIVRIIFCDAEATDVGYMPPEEIAGRVKITGRGGTVLQYGIEALVKAKDFPDTAPILIITDGYIEDSLSVRREHAYIIPKGNKLPFKAKGKVFYMDKR